MYIVILLNYKQYENIIVFTVGGTVAQWGITSQWEGNGSIPGWLWGLFCVEFVCLGIKRFGECIFCLFSTGHTFTYKGFCKFLLFTSVA